MFINNGYYICKREASRLPIPYIEANTLYLPFNVNNNNNGYEFDEYRINLPMDNLPNETLCEIAKIVPELISLTTQNNTL